MSVQLLLLAINGNVTFPLFYVGNVLDVVEELGTPTPVYP